MPFQVLKCNNGIICVYKRDNLECVCVCFSFSSMLNISISFNTLIIALCTALKVGVRVEYMDRGEAEGGQVTAHDFPDGLKPKVYLLYRPGHYDILYPH